jgi:catalase (peroxidase I)
LETERRRLHAWAAGLVKEVEGRRDEALRRLDVSESALTRARERFVADFVVVWTKVMELDRFDLC